MVNKGIVACERLRNRRAILVDVNNLVIELADVVDSRLSWCGLVSLNKLDEVMELSWSDEAPLDCASETVNPPNVNEPTPNTRQSTDNATRILEDFFFERNAITTARATKISTIYQVLLMAYPRVSLIGSPCVLKLVTNFIRGPLFVINLLGFRRAAVASLT